MKNGKKNFSLLLSSIIFFAAVVLVRAQSCDSSCPPAGDSGYASCLQARITDCQNRVSTLQSQANTLSNQISQFNYQINLISLQIAQTEQKIVMLGGRIGEIETSLDSLTQAFSARAVETYKLSRFENNFTYVLGAKDINDAVSRLHYLQKIQESDTNLLEQLQETQITYKNQKSDQETLQKQLTQQQTNLNIQKVAKANLLAATQNDETKYQSLLSQAQAQLAALSSFAQSVGVDLIPHQDISDGWGKYFNQRDQVWGNLLVNNDNTDCRGGPCTLARIGCLVTSFAMVSTHFGGSQTPAEVAVNPANFYSNTANFSANPIPSANGHGGVEHDNPSVSDLQSFLNSGSVVIAGLSMNGGPYPNHYSDHWVVLRSVDGDSFKINDPLYQGAMNVSLKDHYANWTIIQAIVYN